MADPALMSPLVRTRLGLHAVAEHVLAADLYARTGHIGLRVTPGGFGTPVADADDHPRQVRVVGTDLVVTDGDGERSEALSTVGRAAALVGIPPGGPSGVYELSTPLEPDAPLQLDADAARGLMAWLALGDDALHRLRADHRSENPDEVQLWPEHFDLGLTIGEVNFGASPGDASHDEPYLYVGPWKPPPLDDFWNEPFGVRIDRWEVIGIGDAVAFFERAQQRLLGG